MGVAHNSPFRQSPMERHGSLPRRVRSGPIVRVTSLPDVKGGGVLRTAPSTVSVESTSSGKSGVSYRFQPVSDSDAIVEVSVLLYEQYLLLVVLAYMISLSISLGWCDGSYTW